MQPIASKIISRTSVLALVLGVLTTLALVMTLAPTQAHADASWKRLGGYGVYGTMAKVSAQGWSKSDVVIIAGFTSYHDALSASSLAGRYKAPILLTPKDSLHTTTANEIKRLGATKAFIIGGTVALSSNVEKQVRNALTGSKTVERCWGDFARHTAVDVADHLGDYMSDTCIIATSASYHDALTASPYAYATGSPIYLCNNSNEITELVLAAIEREHFKRAVIVGGESVVSAKTEALLRSIGISEVRRCWGYNAYSTSKAFSEWALQQPGITPNYAGVATATGHWDALTGAALCGKNSSIMLLADDGNTSATKVLANNKSKITRGFVFGGPAAVGNKAFNACVNATKQTRAQAAI